MMRTLATKYERQKLLGYGLMYNVYMGNISKKKKRIRVSISILKQALSIGYAENFIYCQ